MHTNQKLLVDYLISKGASYTVLDEYEELLEIKYKNKKDFLYVEVKRMANMYSIGGCGSDLNSKIYNYDHYRVENQ